MHPTYSGVYLCTRVQEKLEERGYFTLLTWPWYHHMVHVKVHPPQKDHPQEIHEAPNGGNLDNLILIGERNRILQKKGVEAPLYYLFHRKFSGV